MRLSEGIRIGKLVFRQPAYIFLTLLVTLVFYMANALIANIQNILIWVPELGFAGSILFVKELIVGFSHTITMTTLVSIIVIGLLTGMLLSLILYKFKMTRDNEKPLGVISSIGIFLGFLVPGCAACGVGIVAAIGLGSSVAALPFQGTEIAFLSIILLLFALYEVTARFSQCRIPAQ